MANLLQALGFTKKAFLAENVEPIANLNQTDLLAYGEGYATVSTLLNTELKPTRTRQQIYQKWAAMESDPLCSSALKILVTAALGGHENTGQMVFLEKTATSLEDKQSEKIADELINDLTTIFNNVAFTIAYRGAAYGDAYARIYSDDKLGVIDLSVDEMFMPPLVQPVERGGRTVGYAVFIGQNNFEKMTIEQLARLKMPRTQWIPQPSVVQKSMRFAVKEDDLNNLPVMPSMAGGSLLYPAETSWDKLMSGLSSMGAQRLRDALDEAYVTVDMESMTAEQQKRTKKSIIDMLTTTKKIVDDAIKTGNPFNSIIRHVLPVNGQKQITNITPMTSSRSATMSIDDIMFYARQTAAAIGPDLSMLGFSDQLTSMFGDNGLGSISALVTEQSRLIRTSLVDFFNHVIDIHTLKKYGVVFPADKRPVAVNFYGSIMAYETKNQNAKTNAAAAAMSLVQGMQMFKELGADKEQMLTFLTKQMLLDEEEAKVYMTIVDAKPPEGMGGDGGFGGDDANNGNDNFNENADNEDA